jgi:hypothetical protein
MRRIYSRPWRNGSLTNPGKIPTCIQVGVRPETTGTLETMFDSCTQLPAGRTGLAGVGRVHVLDRDPNGIGFVFDKALQLPESPTVEPCAHAPARSEVIADVREILHDDLGSPDASGFLDNAFARFVVEMFNAPHFFAGDLPEFLHRTLAAVGLKATTQGQMLITPMAQSFPAPDPARAGGGKRVFPDIHSHRRAGRHRFAVGRLNDQIEKPVPSAKYQVRLFSHAALQDLALVIPEDHRHPNALRDPHPVMFEPNGLKQFNFAGDQARPGAALVLPIPNCRIGPVREAVPICRGINHASYTDLYKYTAQGLSAICPLRAGKRFRVETV